MKSFLINTLIFSAILVMIIIITTSQSNTQSPIVKMNGVTIDGIEDLNDIVESLDKLPVWPTTRVVFDLPPTYAYDYKDALDEIHEVSDLMGEICDSWYMDSLTVPEFKERLRNYLDTLGQNIDIWEIGNEVNGEWCQHLGYTDSVIAKISYAFDTLHSLGKTTAITFYYNPECYEEEDNEMFKWIDDNLPSNIKDSVDYVFLSYWEEDCNNYEPDWAEVFDSVRTIFPNPLLGIGEFGTEDGDKQEFIERYYAIGYDIIDPGYVGGYFWWYYLQDCVPYTEQLWQVIADAMEGTGDMFVKSDMNSIYLFNYPNPFNPVTSINFSIPKQGLVTLKVYDVLGKEVANLVNEVKAAGSYSVEFNGANLSSGIYYYRIESGSFVNVKKMLLIK